MKLIVMAVILMVSVLQGATIQVPLDQPTIQAGIDAAIDGDTVLVDDGHYYERISFLGKKIAVASKYVVDGDTTHIHQCVIDGDTSVVPMVADTGSVVRFVNGEDSLSVLAGFTIQNGVGVGNEGGGIYCNSSFPRLKVNRITNNGSNSATRLNGPLASGSIIDSCSIFGNSGSGSFVMGQGVPVFNGCLFEANGGSGVRIGHDSRINIYGGRIANNAGNGVLYIGSYFETIRDCVIENNGGAGVGDLGFLKWNKPDKSVDPRDSKGIPRNLINCVVRGNGSGAMFYNDVDWTVDSCLFEENDAYAIGMAMDVRLILRNSVIRRNGSMNSGSNGGGIRLFGGGQFLGINCSNSLFDGNMADQGGAIFARASYCPTTISSCTFVNNTANDGSAIYQGGCLNQVMVVDSCIFAFNKGGDVIQREAPWHEGCADSLLIAFRCSDIYGNDSGDWTGQLANYLGTNGNFSADPLFCDTANSNYLITDTSPCAPANNSCGVLVGAYGIGCGNAAPSQFDLSSPPNSFMPPIATRTPMLEWTAATVSDPLAHVIYSLHLSTDSSLLSPIVVPDISSEYYLIEQPLNWASKYWWNVKAVGSNGGETWSSQIFRFRTMTLGDIDGNETVTVSDVVYLVNYIFGGGSELNPIESGDVDCSGIVTVSDAAYLISYLLGGGPAPCEG
ncbi:MAG: right-handed parallel beta-helix repeat-containing protein [bacterium]|nr:right-handed parallel beta-helix repeat-containing protein [bacterium]